MSNASRRALLVCLVAVGFVAVGGSCGTPLDIGREVEANGAARAALAPSANAVPNKKTAKKAKQKKSEPAASAVPNVPHPFPLLGTAEHLYANIYRAPMIEENLLGYMRRGASFRARATSERKGCRAGWVELEHGGYVCSGRGFTISTTPTEVADAPIPPALHAALPYAYAYTVRDDVPQYAMMPDANTQGAAVGAIRTLREWEKAQAAALDAGAETAPAPIVSRVPGGGFPLPPGAPALPESLRAIMLKGFYVSLDGAFAGPEGDRFLRTVRGTYVREADLLVNKPPASRGVLLGGEWTLPIAITKIRGSRATRLDDAGKSLGKESVERHTAFRVAAPEYVFEGQKYVRTADSLLLRPEATRVVRQVPRPPGIPATAKWIHVSLADQSLVAYEGDTPVFTTLVSSGKEGFETPTGLFRIQSKHVSATMDDFASAEGAYSIEDVPWTMYFHGNFALHGAFWHYTFGNVRSHGCVNLAPADAQWLFRWSTPTVPAEWHALYADGRHPGTFVFISP